ncbi:MAG: hypothetical protein Q7S09_02965 [bacterium]|nr:hypothetical protein [bacterium]
MFFHKDTKHAIIINALLNALGAALYVIAVASFMFYAPKNFGPQKTVLVPIAMLLLLVFSAAFMGLALFGRPILWYLDGNKKEALSLLFSTLAIFFAFTVMTLFVLLLSLN